jgi:integrase
MRLQALTSLEPPVPPPLKLPPHVVVVKNSTGRPYLYLQKYRGTPRAEPRVRLPDDPRSAEFWGEYARLMQLPQPRKPDKTFADLISKWQQSPEWAALAPSTRVEWTRHCKRIAAAWGELLVSNIQPADVLALRDAFAHKPADMNNTLRCLSSMLGWSVPRGWRSDNPCREVKPLKGGEGYAPWPLDAIHEAEQVLRPDLWWAVALALYTGQRSGDCLSMKWSAIRADGTILVTQEKTSKVVAVPQHRNLRIVLDTVPRRAVTVLTSTDGTPWTDGGFTASWRKNKPPLVKAGGLVFHGLRKSAVVMLLEAGCTDAEVRSITGQSQKMVEHYAKMVNQEKLAAAAILKWEGVR